MRSRVKNTLCGNALSFFVSIQYSNIRIVRIYWIENRIILKVLDFLMPIFGFVPSGLLSFYILIFKPVLKIKPSKGAQTSVNLGLVKGC
jgi:Na+/H+ antiporter NhaA